MHCIPLAVSLGTQSQRKTSCFRWLTWSLGVAYRGITAGWAANEQDMNLNNCRNSNCKFLKSSSVIFWVWIAEKNPIFSSKVKAFTLDVWQIFDERVADVRRTTASWMSSKDVHVQSMERKKSWTCVQKEKSSNTPRHFVSSLFFAPSLLLGLIGAGLSFRYADLAHNEGNMRLPLSPSCHSRMWQTEMKWLGVC